MRRACFDVARIKVHFWPLAMVGVSPSLTAKKRTVPMCPEGVNYGRRIRWSSEPFSLFVDTYRSGLRLKLFGFNWCRCILPTFDCALSLTDPSGPFQHKTNECT